MKKLLIIFNVILFPFIAFSQTVPLGFTNLPINSAEINSPGRGAEYWNGEWWDNVISPQVPDGTSSGYNGYIRFNWIDMENGQGNYTFTGPWPSIESWLKIVADRGETLSFGIMSVCDGCDVAMAGGKSAYPLYLHNLMQSESTNSKDWKSSGGTWVPNWNSPNYLGRFEILLDTLTKFLKSKSYTPSVGPNAGRSIRYIDMIDYVDIRGYGNYGEWHNYPYWNETPIGRVATVASLKRIIDAHKTYFPDRQLVVPIGAFDNGNASATPTETGYYLLTTSNAYGKIGWRRDNLGEKLYDDILVNSPYSFNGYKFDTALVNRWKYAVIGGEPINGGGQYANGGPPYFDLRREINLYHISHFGNGNYPDIDITKTSVRDTLREAFKISGYRYQFNGGSMTDLLMQNSNFNITLRIRNIGVSPIYQKRWNLKFELRTSTDVVVQTFNSYFNPYLFLPSSSDSIISQVFTLGNVSPGSNYKLVMYFQDSIGYFKHMPLALSSPVRNSDGSYTLRTGLKVISSGSLPTIFNSFEGKFFNGYNLLHWQTNCDRYNDRFEVEKGYDGKSFVKIYQLSTNDSNCLYKDYEFKDFASPFSSYYRVKQVNKDESHTYSKIIYINTFDQGISIYPTITSNSVELSIRDNDQGPIQICIYTIDGKIVKEISLFKNGPLDYPINISDLKSGYYIFKIINGRSTVVKRIFKV